MSIIKKLFENSSNTRKTSVYKVENQTLIELNELPGNGSINAIIEDLGYNNNQVHIIWTFDSKKKSNIGVKIFTKQPVFVLSKEGVKNLTMPVLTSELKNVDWSSEYSSFTIESILLDGIHSKNIELDFLKSVTRLQKTTDEIFFAPDLDLYLYFKGIMIVGFSSKDGLNAESKWLKGLNLPLFNKMLKEAYMFQDSGIDAIEEVNKQCIALQSIPQAFSNLYLSEHLNDFENYNFYNLLAAHYLPPFNIDEFSFVNKGRYTSINGRILKVSRYVYEFDQNRLLIKSWKE